MKKEDKTLIALEIPNNLKSKLKLEAYQNDLSLSATIRVILNDYFGLTNSNKESEGIVVVGTKFKKDTYDRLMQLSMSSGLPIGNLLEVLVSKYLDNEERK